MHGQNQESDIKMIVKNAERVQSWAPSLGHVRHKRVTDGIQEESKRYATAWSGVQPVSTCSV